MFNQKSYKPSLITARKNLENLRNDLFQAWVDGDREKERKLAPKVEKAERVFVSEHDKYCDKYNLQNLKLTENWSKFWSK